MKNNDDYNFLYDEKLGKYGNMRKEVLYRLKRDEYDELARSGELDKHCLYVEKEAHKLREKTYKDYEHLGLQSFSVI